MKGYSNPTNQMIHNLIHGQYIKIQPRKEYLNKGIERKFKSSQGKDVENQPQKKDTKIREEFSTDSLTNA